MKCLKHPEVVTEICDEFVCGKCYLEELMSTPVSKLRRTGHEVYFVLVYSPEKHRKVLVGQSHP